MKVCIRPTPHEAPHGLQRVVEALYRYLPRFGIEVVDTPEEADLINTHATAYEHAPDKPYVYSSHGLYWAEQPWGNGYKHANRQMIDLMARANAVTVVSQWTAHAITRGMLVHPTVIYHGVDPDEFAPPVTPGAYVLWNKARADYVSNPDEMDKVAAMFPETPFVSTLGTPSPNVRIVGSLPYGEMKAYVRGAGVYLATARETFGIGTLEAMACGVPVAGWDHGGQREIIKQGETGYLAPVGDYDALAECIRKCYAERERLGANARQDVLDRWQWEEKIGLYASVFKVTYDEFHTPRPKVSVAVTAHNLGAYLGDALESVYRQSLTDWECLIIDDASTDNTPQVAQEFVEKDSRFRYLPTPTNLKLSGARNFGFAQAQGKYIIPLDADDMLTPDALKMLSEPLDNNPFIHIAYGHLDIINNEGENRRRNDWPMDGFSWEGQMSHLNQLPYCGMMRREVWERSGGYRRRDWRAEDASFWTRVTSFGFRAQKVTQETTLLYRIRPNSKGQTERAEGHSDGDWTAWFPWRTGAESGPQGWELLKKGKRPPIHLTPFGAQGVPPEYSYPIHSHHDPVVSVIIPVGPKHAPYVIDALDCLVAQTYPFWEAIVVNDTGKPLDTDFAPFARQVEGGKGIAASRNKGVAAARAPLVLFLDADDLLVPDALQLAVEAFFEAGSSKYIYTDWYDVNSNGEAKAKGAEEFNQRSWKVSHPISVLIPRRWVLDVGGFDEQIKGWEDWEFFIKLVTRGYCGKRLARPLLVYRTFAGQRREQSLEDADVLLPVLKERYGDYYTGVRTMAGCCGGELSTDLLRAKQQMGLLKTDASGSQGDSLVSNGLVRMEYTGLNTGAVPFQSVNGKPLTKTYRGGRNPLDRYADAPYVDAILLELSGRWKPVKVAAYDFQQAAVAPVDHLFAPQGMVAPAEPVQTTRDELKDPGTMNVADLRNYTVGLGVISLNSLLELEQAGQNRATAVKAIKDAIKIVERVG